MLSTDEAVEIARITPFSPIEGSAAVAGVTLIYGAVAISAKLCRDKNQPERFYLRLPSRKGTNRQGQEEYFKEVWFRDSRLLDEALKEVVRQFDQITRFSNN